jgi:sulfatase maturation enzyme AslB (radical SAM superfamily)
MLDNKFVPQFNITLRCNMYHLCKYCYLKEEQSKMATDMDCGDFEKILGWFAVLGVDEIIMLGGEPTTHPFFTKFIDIAGNKKISVRVFTNGTCSTDVFPLFSNNNAIKEIFFHYDAGYLNLTEKTKDLFFHNLAGASKSGKKIWIRWNIDKPDADVDSVISLARQYSTSIGYSITVPTTASNRIPIHEIKDYVRILMELIQSAKANDIEIEPARAMPLCAFSPDQLQFLKENGNLQGKCSAINDLTIRTDLSLQLCSVTHYIHTTRVSSLSDLQAKIEFLKNEELKLRKKPLIPECSDCAYFATGECQGGCYGYKLFN